MTDAADIQQSWPLPADPRPIVIVGAGGIVTDAHLPAYRKADLPVAAIYDIDREKAKKVAADWGIAKVLTSLDRLNDLKDVVFDIAVPPSQITAVIEHLPDGAVVLIQKPMGDDLAMARLIRELCHRKSMTAAVNHQLRFAPQIVAARSIIGQGLIGDVHAMEVRVTVYTPWHLWTFLEQSPRVEIQYHSVHYLDLFRHMLGDPRGVYCKTLKHPAAPDLDSVRTYAILDYGANVMAGLQINHMHGYGARHQESYIKWEGTRGAIKTQLGLLLDYPQGQEDWLEYCTGDLGGDPGDDPTWCSLKLEGTWFPDAFIGPMANLQRFAAGEDDQLSTSIDDVVKTMALVEACYTSSERGHTPIPSIGDPK